MEQNFICTLLRLYGMIERPFAAHLLHPAPFRKGLSICATGFPLSVSALTMSHRPAQWAPSLPFSSKTFALFVCSSSIDICVCFSTFTLPARLKRFGIPFFANALPLDLVHVRSTTTGVKSLSGSIAIPRRVDRAHPLEQVALPKATGWYAAECACLIFPVTLLGLEPLLTA